mgnify:CR=1 FL=1
MRSTFSKESGLHVFRLCRAFGSAGLPMPIKSGSTPLFGDPRIDWACDRLSEWGLPIAGRRVLELGPLEAGHTACLRQRGAGEVVAIGGQSTKLR